MCRYLWYLSPKAAALSFFDPHVLVDKKRKVTAALKTDAEEDNINQYVLNTKKSIGLINKGLKVFICVSSMQYFKRSKINTDFLTTDP